MDAAIKGASRAQLDIGGTVGTYCPACGTSRERSYSVSTRAIGVYCNSHPRSSTRVDIYCVVHLGNAE